MIEMTIGLPMYRSKHIGWLALESLARQVNVPCGWELLVMEEQEEAVGREEVMRFKDRLAAVGCLRTDYVALAQWIPLAQKWRHLALLASQGSRVFLLQAADCYSQPSRLKETYDLSSEGDVDWVQSPKGLFYDIETRCTAGFDADAVKDTNPCALNMAARTDLMRQLPISDRRAAVDFWLFQTLSAIKAAPLNIVRNESSNWEKGLDTHGLNNISGRRGWMLNSYAPPFIPYTGDLKGNLPADILVRLRRSRWYTRRRLVVRMLPPRIVEVLRNCRRRLGGGCRHE